MDYQRISLWKIITVLFLFFQGAVLFSSALGGVLTFSYDNTVYSLLVIQAIQLCCVGAFLWKTKLYRYISWDMAGVSRALVLGIPLLVLSSLGTVVAQVAYSPFTLARLFVTCLMIGISEEAIYRGVLYGLARDRLGGLRGVAYRVITPPTEETFAATGPTSTDPTQLNQTTKKPKQKRPFLALLIPALLFGAAHLINFIGISLDWRVMLITVLYTGSIGFFLTVIYAITNSFAGVVLLHTLYNYLIMISFPLEETLMPEPYSPEMAISSLGITFLFILCSCALLWRQQKGYGRKQ